MSRIRTSTQIIQDWPVREKVAMVSEMDQRGQENRHYDCSGTLTTVAHAPRVDAQASDTRTGVGGWCLEMGVDGIPDPRKSR